MNISLRNKEGRPKERERTEIEGNYLESKWLANEIHDMLDKERRKRKEREKKEI